MDRCQPRKNKPRSTYSTEVWAFVTPDDWYCIVLRCRWSVLPSLILYVVQSHADSETNRSASNAIPSLKFPVSSNSCCASNPLIYSVAYQLPFNGYLLLIILWLWGFVLVLVACKAAWVLIIKLFTLGYCCCGWEGPVLAVNSLNIAVMSRCSKSTQRRETCDIFRGLHWMLFCRAEVNHVHEAGAAGQCLIWGYTSYWKWKHKGRMVVNGSM